MTAVAILTIDATSSPVEVGVLVQFALEGRNLNTRLMMVVDDSEVRQSLQTAIEREPEFALEILEVDSIDDAIACAGESLHLDLAILGLHFQNSASVTGLLEFKKAYPGVPMVILSDQDNPALIRDVFALGVSGYVQKESNIELLRNAVEIVLDGGIYLPRSLISSIQDNAKKAGADEWRSDACIYIQPPVNHPICLQARQKDVLRLVNEGLSNKEISRQLNFTVGTTKNYLASLLRIFGVVSRSQLICLLRNNPKILNSCHE